LKPTALPGLCALGVMVAQAVTAHEVPQEMRDSRDLLCSGYGRGKALSFNSLSAASFIYIAAADLIPGLHRRATPSSPCFSWL